MTTVKSEQVFYYVNGAGILNRWVRDNFSPTLIMIR